MNHLVKTLLRLWIAGVSTAGLILGWVALAHSGKPAPLAGQAAANTGASTAAFSAPQLEAIPSLDELVANPSGGSQLSAPIQPSVTFNFPRLRTMGS